MPDLAKMKIELLHLHVLPVWGYGSLHQGEDQKFTSDIPECSDRCPSFDGKRCDHLIGQPGRICQPAVSYLASHFEA